MIFWIHLHEKCNAHEIQIDSTVNLVINISGLTFEETTQTLSNSSCHSFFSSSVGCGLASVTSWASSRLGLLKSLYRSENRWKTSVRKERATQALWFWGFDYIYRGSSFDI